jgi:hypothetical protein
MPTQPPTHQENRPGYRFKEGKLRIFKEDEVMLIRGWPDPNAVRKTRYDKAWDPFTPRFALVRPYRPARKKGEAKQLELGLDATPRRPTLAEQKKRAFDQFRFSLPSEVAKAVEPFREDQWHLLTLAFKVTAFPEFLAANPGLAFCLAHNIRFRPRRSTNPDLMVERVIGMKQKDIAAWLGFPGTGQAVKTLRKVPAAALDLASALRLRAAIQDPATAGMLSHVSCLNRSILAIAATPSLRRMVTPRLLDDIAGQKRDAHYPHTALLLDQVQNLTEALQPPRVRRTFHTLDSVTRLHHDLSVQYVETRGDEISGYRFPSPPNPGTQSIVPLRTPADLLEEGRLQGNCVGSYAKSVADRRVYIYRVLRPERSTLSLVRQSGSWQIEQLCCEANHRVDKRTKQAVEEWLESWA